MRRFGIIYIVAAAGIVLGWTNAANADESAPKSASIYLSYKVDTLPDYATLIEPALDAEIDLPEPEGTPIERAELSIGWANRLMAESTAKPATRWLIGIDDQDDRKLLHACAKAALHYIDQGFDAMKEAKDVPSADKRKLRTAAETLESFAGLFVLADETQIEGDPAKAFRSAAHGLAVVREHKDAEVAACALLWQSFAWQAAGRADRALTTLPPTMTKPEELPYDFFARLLRVRVLGSDSKTVAGVTETIRISQLTSDWLKSRRRAKYAKRTSALVQSQLIDQWIKQLDDEGAVAELKKMQDKLRTDYLPITDTEGELEFYELDEAVPVMIEVAAPGTEEPPTTIPASQPETQPTTKPAATHPE